VQRRSSIVFVPACVLLLTLLTGCTSKHGAPTPSSSRPTGLAASPVTDQHISIVNFAFAPRLFTIKAGDRIIWTQTTTTIHTVTSGTVGPPDANTKKVKATPDGLFASGDLKAGASYPVTFGKPGTYPYFCSHHPDRMVGTIIVQ